MADTLGEAHQLGWRVMARCIDPSRPAKHARHCTWSSELHLGTLVVTRGRDFPLACLHERLKCPRCGSGYASPKR